MQPRSLQAFLSSIRGALPVNQAVAIVIDVLADLSVVHGQGRVYGRLKPRCILMGRAGHAAIASPGMADVAQGSELSEEERASVSAYLSPEQRAGGPVDPRSDIFSVGVVLYETLTRALPWETAQQQALQDTPPAPRALNPSISPALARVIIRCLERNPDDRYQTVDELTAALMAATGHEAAAPASQPAGRTATSSMWALVAGGGILVLVLAAVLMWGTRSVAGRPTVVPPQAQSKGAAALASVTTLPAPAAAPSAAPSAAAMAQAAQPASAPSSTATLPPAPTPYPTFTPYPTSTPLPTSTPVPIPTQPPTATPVRDTPTPIGPPRCSTAVGGTFAGVWNSPAIYSRVGCPTSPEHTSQSAEERFEHGAGLWRGEIDTVYAIFDTGLWRAYKDPWLAGRDPDYTCGTPSSPPSPLRGFGKVWCDYQDARAGLGNALEAEAGYGMAGGGPAESFQDFDAGFMFYSRRFGRLYVVYSNGTWQGY